MAPILVAREIRSLRQLSIKIPRVTRRVNSDSWILRDFFISIVYIYITNLIILKIIQSRSKTDPLRNFRDWKERKKNDVRGGISR